MIRDSSPQLLLCVPNHPYVFILGTDLAPLTNCSGLDGLYSFTSRVSNLYVCGGIPLWHFKLLFLSLKEASWFVIVLLDTNISHSVVVYCLQISTLRSTMIWSTLTISCSAVWRCSTAPVSWTNARISLILVGGHIYTHYYIRSYGIFSFTHRHSV